jgi:putative ABC transport system substrate-binding protein
MMDRRAFVAASLGFLAAPLVAPAQPAGRAFRVGWLDANPTGWTGWRMALLAGLNDLGWAFGRDFVFEPRKPDDGRDYEQLYQLASELVRARMDVIVAWGGPATEAARAATRTIPVVFLNVDSPSLSTPAANVTGIFNGASELPPELLRLLMELVPGVVRVDILRDPGNVGAAALFARTREAAHALGLNVRSRDVMEVADLDSTFAAMKRDGVHAVLVHSAAWMIPWLSRIAFAAREQRLPLISDWNQLTQAGGLLSYRWDDNQQLARAAAMVDRILGSPPECVGDPVFMRPDGGGWRWRAGP